MSLIPKVSLIPKLSFIRTLSLVLNTSFVINASIVPNACLVPNASLVPIASLVHFFFFYSECVFFHGILASSYSLEQSLIICLTRTTIEWLKSILIMKSMFEPLYRVYADEACPNDQVSCDYIIYIFTKNEVNRSNGLGGVC